MVSKRTEFGLTSSLHYFRQRGLYRQIAQMSRPNQSSHGFHFTEKHTVYRKNKSGLFVFVIILHDLHHDASDIGSVSCVL